MGTLPPTFASFFIFKPFAHKKASPHDQSPVSDWLGQGTLTYDLPELGIGLVSLTVIYS
jgi:hypothetical protein